MRPMAFILGCVLISAGTYPSAFAQSSLSKKGTIVAADVFGCRKSEIYDRIVDLYGDDKVAALKLRDRSIHSGDCSFFGKGTTVSVQDRSGYLYCLRPSGDPDCLWSGRNAIEQ
jgi:hypothetical protein